MSQPAIDCRNLSKRYGRSPEFALKDLTLQVAPGEVYGFLGPNGAGKSTTIRTLLNFIQPTKGTATIAGYDSARQSVEAKRHIGYLSGEFSLYKDFDGGQFLDYMGRLQPAVKASRRQELCALFGAELDKPTGELSKGELQAKAAHSFMITFRGTTPLAELQRIKQLTIVSHDEHLARIEVEGDLTPLFRVLAKHPVQRLDQETANLEAQFMRFYEDKS
jgi:ABC-type transport system involved in cytochrome c biogenesis ATPase subunit